MAMYFQGDAPSVKQAEQSEFMRNSNGKTSLLVASGRKSENVIKTLLSPQKSDTSIKAYSGQRIRINISGLLYETRLKTLRRYPTTLLGNEEMREAYFDEDREEYFFDRDRHTFDSILRFYQSGGILIKPNNVPEDIFFKELKFYKLEQFVHKQEENDAETRAKYEEKMPKGKKMRKVWRLMEEPASSLGAKIISILSVTVIFLSIWSFCIETLPSSKALLESVCVPYGETVETTTVLAHVFFPGNESAREVNKLHGISTTVSETASTATTRPPCRVDLWRYPFFVIETFCVICFTTEVVVRFIVTPSKISFLKSPLNIIDIAAILPYFIQLAVDAIATENNSSDDSLGSLVVLRVLRLVRILRVFKLSRYSTKLRVLGRTLIASVGELSILVFFIFLAMILFSTVVYFVESTSGPGNKFDSIPASFWWAVVTMTTVGYGDVVPRTVLGKIVGFLCAITGVLCIALPVPSIVNNFVKQLEEAENPTKKKAKRRKKKTNSNSERIKTVFSKRKVKDHRITVTTIQDNNSAQSAPKES